MKHFCGFRSTAWSRRSAVIEYTLIASPKLFRGCASPSKTGTFPLARQRMSALAPNGRVTGPVGENDKVTLNIRLEGVVVLNLIRARKGSDDRRIALLKLPRVMDVSVAQDDEAGILRAGILARLPLPIRGSLSSDFASKTISGLPSLPSNKKSMNPFALFSKSAPRLSMCSASA